MTDSEIVEFVRKHHEPCVTATQIAAEFGVTNEAVNKRLRELEGGSLESKTVGASAKVWYVSG